MKKLISSVLVMFLGGMMCLFHHAYADEPKHGKCTMTIYSDKNTTFETGARASGPCNGLVRGLYNSQGLFLIIGMVTTVVDHSGQKFLISTPGSDKYIGAWMTVYTVKVKEPKTTTNTNQKDSTPIKHNGSDSEKKTTDDQTTSDKSTDNQTVRNKDSVTHDSTSNESTDQSDSSVKSTTPVKPKKDSSNSKPKNDSSTKSRNTTDIKKTNSNHKSTNVTESNNITQDDVTENQSSNETKMIRVNTGETTSKTSKAKSSNKIGKVYSGVPVHHHFIVKSNTNKKKQKNQFQKSNDHSMTKEVALAENTKSKSITKHQKSKLLWILSGLVAFLLIAGGAAYWFKKSKAKWQN